MRISSQHYLSKNILLLWAILFPLSLNIVVSGQISNSVSNQIKKLKDKEVSVRREALNELGSMALSHSINYEEIRVILPLLIEALKDQDANVRSSAAHTLSYLGKDVSTAIPALTEALKDQDVRVRQNVMNALGHMGVGAIPALIETLKDQDTGLRLNAISALGTIHTENYSSVEVQEVIPVFIEALKDQDTRIRTASASIISNIGDQAKAAVPALIEALKDQDAGVRSEAARALSSMNVDARTAIPALIAALKDSNTNVRHDAANALNSIFSGLELDNIEAGAIIPALIEALNTQDTVLRISVISMLESIGAQAKSAVPSLIKELKHEDKNVRSGAANALNSMGAEAKDAIPALIEALKDKDIGVRNNAASALANMVAEAKDIIPTLIEVLLSKEFDVRVKAGVANALGKIGAEAKIAIPALIEMLKYKDASNQNGPASVLANSAAAALANMDNEAVLALITTIKNKDYSVRYLAIEILGNMGAKAKDAVPTLIEALKDIDPGVRTRAIDALGKIGEEPKTVIPALIGEVKNRAFFINAARALGNMGIEAKIAIPVLIEYLKEPNDEQARGTAAIAIASICNAIYDAKDTSALPLLKEANESLNEIQNQDAKKAHDAINRTIDYLELLSRSQLTQVIKDHPFISITILLPVTLAGIFFFSLYIRPLWLIGINKALSSIGETKLGNLDQVKTILRLVLLIGYRKRVIDAWIKKHIKIARNEYANKLSVSERKFYVKEIPVFLDEKKIDSLTISDLQHIFEQKLSYLLIWGEGGAGKTSLACWLGKSAMEEEKRKRLCQIHLMLPVLLEPGLEVKSANSETSLLKVIQNQVRTIIKEEEAPPIELIRQLIIKRRILLIVDSLSEMGESSRQNIVSQILDIPVNACVVTSRIDEPLDQLSKSSLKPQRIKGKTLVSFMDSYLCLRNKQSLFEDKEFLSDCLKLSQIVGDREITAFFAKSYAEAMIAAKERTIDSELPDNIPDLMVN